MKIAIVTGASAGMGRETVIQLADRFSGLDEIWVIARRMERLLELEADVPVTVRRFQADLSKSDQLGQLEHALKAVKPQVKFLINAAGFGKIGRVGQIDPSFESDMVALNCQALCNITNLALPYMPDNSRIIQYASSAGFMPQPGFATYAATKAFVISYSRALNEELRDREIHVTAVCPGPVSTEFFDVAETSGKMPFYKNLFMAKPENVVAKALRDAMMGKSLSIYGLPMQAFYMMSKVVPHSVLLKALAAINH